jgi:hypothetical protein
MKKIFLSFILLIAVAFMASAATAFVIGTDLISWNADFKVFITGGTDYSSVTVFRFMEYVCGVVDANFDLGGSKGPTWFKLPIGTTVRDVSVVVSNYLDNHPEKTNESGAFIVVEALSNAFPH